jgi:hypothetical protein
MARVAHSAAGGGAMNPGPHPELLLVLDALADAIAEALLAELRAEAAEVEQRDQTANPERGTA